MDATPPHRASHFSAELTAYFEHLMDEFAEKGDRHLVFTPPTTRGSLITRAEAFAINVQRDYVPTLTDMGRWPLISVGQRPDVMSREQREWLSQHWGECARLWIARGCPMPTEIKSLKPAREAKKREDYKALVMHTFEKFEHADKREFINKRAEVERKARERL
jgi:hypothetical protein